MKLSRKLAELLVEYDEFDNEIKRERNYTKEIEDQIQMVKKKTLELSEVQVSEDKYMERILKVNLFFYYQVNSNDLLLLHLYTGFFSGN